HRRGADDAAQISGRATRGAPPRGSDRVIIAVLGGSHGAFATAADLSLAGHRVRLWRRRPEDLAALSKGITLKAEQRQGAARLDKATADLGRVRELYPATRPCVDAVDVALTNAGRGLHPPLVLANAGAIDRGKFDVHAAGTTESARRLIDAVDAERVASRKGWGFPAPHYEMATYYDEARAAEGLYGAGAKGKLVASGLWNEVLTFEHRYVTEDVELGLPFFE